jgi:hypothetical protein
VETLLNIKQIMEFIPNSSMTAEEKEAELNKFHLKNCKIIKKLAYILKGLSVAGDFSPKVEAIKLCKHFRLV